MQTKGVLGHHHHCHGNHSFSQQVAGNPGCTDISPYGARLSPPGRVTIMDRANYHILVIV